MGTKDRQCFHQGPNRLSNGAPLTEEKGVQIYKDLSLATPWFDCMWVTIKLGVGSSLG